MRRGGSRNVAGWRLSCQGFGTEEAKREAEAGSVGDLFERAAIVRRELGHDGLKVVLPPDFEDPAVSRRVLGLPE